MPPSRSAAQLRSLRERSRAHDIVGRHMKYTTYSRYLPGLLETLNLQALLDQLADFLLQSGFAGGPYSHPFWGEFGEDDSDRSLDALRQAILQRLIDEGYLNVKEAPQMPAGQQPLFGPGGMAREAAQQVQFSLTEKGIDFLGYKTLKHLLGGIG